MTACSRRGCRCLRAGNSRRKRQEVTTGRPRLGDPAGLPGPKSDIWQSEERGLHPFSASHRTPSALPLPGLVPRQPPHSHPASWKCKRSSSRSGHARPGIRLQAPPSRQKPRPGPSQGALTVDRQHACVFTSRMACPERLASWKPSGGWLRAVAQLVEHPEPASLLHRLSTETGDLADIPADGSKHTTARAPLGLACLSPAPSDLALTRTHRQPSGTSGGLASFAWEAAPGPGELWPVHPELNGDRTAAHSAGWGETGVPPHWGQPQAGPPATFRS